MDEPERVSRLAGGSYFLPRHKKEVKNMNKKNLIVIGIIVYIIIFFIKGSNEKQQVINSTANITIKPSPQTKPTKTKEQIQKERKEATKKQEEKNKNYATQYCNKRENSNKQYSVITSDDITEINKSVKKKGLELTQNDCYQIVTYLNSWGSENIADIVERRYWIGMGKVELLSSLGWPNDVNVTNYGLGVNEQWVYNKDSYGSAYYIYLENNKVTSYQDF